MSAFDLREWLAASCPGTLADGSVAVIGCYFDDSGTHSASNLAVWGGVIGTMEHINLLNEKWRVILNRPMPGKPALTKFGVSDCARGRGEFEGYNQGERDRLRFIFRQAIIDSGVAPITFGVDVAAWNDLVTGEMRDRYDCGPSGAAFSGCTDAAINVAKHYKGMPLACVFDRGQLNRETASLTRDAEDKCEEQGLIVAFSFSKVIDVPVLQAADTIATEHYWYCLKCLDFPETIDPPLDPHLKSLLSYRNVQGHLMRKSHILKLRREFLVMKKAEGG